MTKSKRIRILTCICLCILIVMSGCSVPPTAEPEITAPPEPPKPTPAPVKEEETESDPIRWFENEPDASAEDLEDIKHIEAYQRNPSLYYLYMYQSGRSDAIAFTDGRVVDFGYHGGETVGYGHTIVSFDGRLVCRPSAPLEALKEEGLSAQSSILYASLDGGPLQLVTKDFKQYMVLEHKNLIFYLRETPGNSGLFSWSEGAETRILSEANQFVCSANGAYILVKGTKTLYCIEVNSLATIEVTGIVPDIVEDLCPVAISNNGNYIYYEYGYGVGKRSIACAQVDRESGEIEIVCEVTGTGNAEVVFNYDGTQAILTMGGGYWAFSPSQGLRKTDHMPIEALWLPSFMYSNKKHHDFTFINQYYFYYNDGHIVSHDISGTYSHRINVSTCAVANFDDVFASMITPPQNTNSVQDYRFYFARTVGTGFCYISVDNSVTLDEFEIVDGSVSKEKTFAKNVVAFRVSVDNTKVYYLTDPSENTDSNNGGSIAQLWYKEGLNEPVLVAENVCYTARGEDSELSYRMSFNISPDGSKVAYIVDLDSTSKLGTLMVVDNLGQPKIISHQSTTPLCIDNDGNVLLIKHPPYITEWTVFDNFYNLYLYDGDNEVLLKKDISLAWYT